MTTEPDIELCVPNDNMQTETSLQDTMPVITVNGIAPERCGRRTKPFRNCLPMLKSPIAFNTTIYGGFKQTGSLPQNFSGNDMQIKPEILCCTPAISL